jgi:hypothetical protein
MQQSKGFFRYLIKNTYGKDTEYASLCHAKRVNGKKINDEIWLGRVIDKEKHIFYTKKDGFLY